MFRSWVIPIAFRRLFALKGLPHKPGGGWAIGTRFSPMTFFTRPAHPYFARD